MLGGLEELDFITDPLPQLREDSADHSAHVDIMSSSEGNTRRRGSRGGAKGVALATCRDGVTYINDAGIAALLVDKLVEARGDGGDGLAMLFKDKVRTVASEISS